MLTKRSSITAKRTMLQQCILLCIFGLVNPAHSQVSNTEDDSEYVFDSAMFRGSNINQKKMLKLSANEILAGQYKVDVFVNQQFIEQSEMEFIEDKQNVYACIRPEQAEKWSILVQPNLELNAKQCASIEALAGAGELSFDHAKMRVDIGMPHINLKQMPRGYVAPALWNAGQSIAFVNYMANYYHNEISSGQQSTSDNAYLSLNGGINFGKWQFRQQSSINYYNNESDLNIIRSYIKRPLSSIASELTLGELNSSGIFFSGMNFHGLNLKSDERMLPDSQRGYAPVIQGIAQTMARVSVKQNSREIYQTTVAAGPFKITDLYPTSYNGDLEVTIYEADGQSSSFKVPFSSVPESVRAGKMKYNFDLGKTIDAGEDALFANATVQYGLSNALTLNSGLRVADEYQAAVVGTALSNRFGAFGLDMTYSHAGLPEEGSLDGWMLGFNYSKSIPTTNTNFAIAGYRFSTEGYRDLADVLAIRDHVNNNNNSNNMNTSNNNNNSTNSTDYTSAQRSRLNASINQNFGKYGSLTLSGSAQNYYDQRDDDYQLQIGYGKTFVNGTSMNLNIARQTYSENNISNENYSNDYTDTTNTIYGLSLSFPLDKNKPRAPDVSLGYQHSQDASHYQATISGVLDEASTTNYHVGLSHDESNHNSSMNAGLQKRFSKVNANFATAISDNSWQASAGLQGAIALHSGGVTLGPYLGDSFALIEAFGAEGARVSNSHESRINKKGYALVPALTPYKSNSIALNPEGMSSEVDLDQGEHKVVPYAGATIKVKFKTRSGQALLLKTLHRDGTALPLGADVFDQDGQIVAVVGQASQIYFRTEQTQGRLDIVWGENTDERCQTQYDLQHAERTPHFKKLSSICSSGE